jgi:hypothetical protein
MPVAAAFIEIRFRRTDSIGQWTFVKIPAGQDSVLLKGVERGVSYQIEARSVALSGAASDWVAQTHIVSALSIAPLTPTSLAATSLADGVHLTWLASDVQRSDVEYEIQRTADLSGAPDPAGWATLNRVRSLRYTDGVTDGIVRWYRVRASTYGGVTTAFSSNINSRGKTVADGATVGATIGPGGNVTGAVDANGRAIVDLTSSHLNKNLENMPDGITFKRVANVNGDNTFHVSTSFLVQASMLPNQVVLITYTMPSPSLLIGSWLAQTLGRTDGSTLTVLASAGGNLLINGDGESGALGTQAPGWTLGANSGLITANDFVHSGAQAMKIGNATPANSFSNQNVTLVGGQVYVLEGWIKTDALTGGSPNGALLKVSIASGITSFTILTKFGAYDAGFTTTPTIGLPADSVARGYTFVQCWFIPATSGVITLFVQNIATNSEQCWYDDIKLYPHTGPAYSGLAASTGYYLYSFINRSTGAITYVNGAPPGTSPSDTLAQQCTLDERIQLPMKKITTPSGGSGSDTGGGSGTCPEFDAPVYVRRYSDEGLLVFEGEIKAGEVRGGYESDDSQIKRGDFLKGYSFAQGQDVFRAVQHASLVPCAGWMRIDGVRFTACETVWDGPLNGGGQWTPAWKVPGAVQDNTVGLKVLIQVEADWDDEHNYYAGTRLIHNAFILPC